MKGKKETMVGTEAAGEPAVTPSKIVVAIPEKMPPALLEILHGRNIDQLADNIRACDIKIRGNDKLSMPEVLIAGNDVYGAKEVFRRAKQKSAFKTWVENTIGIKYGRAYSYLRVALAAAMEPKIKEMGFTEALEYLGLVTRPPKERESGDTGAKPPRGKRNKDASLKPVTVGGVEVLFDGEGYLLEVGDDWQDVLMSAIADKEKFAKVLAGTGLLITVKAEQEK